MKSSFPAIRLIPFGRQQQVKIIISRLPPTAPFYSGALCGLYKPAPRQESSQPASPPLSTTSRVPRGGGNDPPKGQNPQQPRPARSMNSPGAPCRSSWYQTSWYLQGCVSGTGEPPGTPSDAKAIGMTPHVPWMSQVPHWV